MYLLIRSRHKNGYREPDVFTFHNVSINSCASPEGSSAALVFTFHNVSINSMAEVCNMREVC